ncbi:unnamed protein product [Haemonchus placei]|uniref:Uncharacterized protein n=1 Tax=Haemonchus placei TaxID=6290 RepID=A0A0N4WNI1_HAEPC|nr:unnamed protein product [Haemonchus placei]
MKCETTGEREKEEVPAGYEGNGAVFGGSDSGGVAAAPMTINQPRIKGETYVKIPNVHESVYAVMYYGDAIQREREACQPPSQSPGY